MLCSKCGGQNSVEANFCQRCGVDFRSATENQPANRGSLSEERAERDIYFVRPTVLFIQLGYVAAVISGFIIVALLYQVGVATGIQISGWLAVLVGLLPLIAPAIYHVRRNSIGYRLTNSKIEISAGIVSQHFRSIPLRTIQDVGVSAGILQRLLGVGDLIIDNASEIGGKVVLQNINSPKHHADILLNQLREFDRH